MKGFLLLGDFVSLVTTCVEDKTAAWALNLNLQSSFKVEIASGAAAVSSSNDLKLLFYGPHARDSCKVTHASAFQFRKSALFLSQTLVFFFALQVWDAVIHRVAQVAAMRWSRCVTRQFLLQITTPKATKFRKMCSARLSNSVDDSAAMS